MEHNHITRQMIDSGRQEKICEIRKAKFIVAERINELMTTKNARLIMQVHEILADEFLKLGEEGRMNYRDAGVYYGDKAKYISCYDTTFYYSMRYDGRLYGIEINTQVNGKSVVRVYHEPDEKFEDKIDLDNKRDYNDAILCKRGFENHESAIEYVIRDFKNAGG